MQQRTAEQLVVLPVPQLLEENVDVVRLVPREKRAAAERRVT